MTISTLNAFLAEGELDDLVRLHSEIDRTEDGAAGYRTRGHGDRTAGDASRDTAKRDSARQDEDSAAQTRLQSVISVWSDRQAVANLLMYADLIPADLRVGALIRGLTSRSDGYLQLAAAVGVGSVGSLCAEDRTALSDALLDLVAVDTGPAAVRAAAEISALLDPARAPLLVALLRHPDPTVRHNLTVALTRALGDRSLADLLGDSLVVSAEDAVAATQILTDDGIDINRPASSIRMLVGLPYLPNLRQWAERAR